MSLRQPAEIRSFAFGEPGGDLAGVVSVWDGGLASSFGATAGRVEGIDSEAEWIVAGAGFELVFAPTTEVAELDLAGAGVHSHCQLARVRGTMVVDGAERAVDSPGRRTRRIGALDGKRFDSLRAVSAWFGAEDGLAVLAARPRKARGHESDVLAGVLFDGGQPVSVGDPRLSSTYDADGRPKRVGLELWIGEDEDEHARRVAGEALDGAATADDPPLRAQLLGMRMGGRGGVGVYELLGAR